MAISASCFLALNPLQQQAALYEALVGVQPVGTRVAVNVARPDNQTPYTAGDVVTTGFLFTDISPEEGRSISIRGGYVLYGEAALPAGMTTFTLYIFNAPVTVVDNAAFDLGATVAAAQANYLGSITTGTAVDAGTIVQAPFASINQVVTPLETSTNLFGVLVTNGGFTPGANSSVVGVTLEAVTA